MIEELVQAIKDMDIGDKLEYRIHNKIIKIEMYIAEIQEIQFTIYDLHMEEIECLVCEFEDEEIEEMIYYIFE